MSVDDWGDVFAAHFTTSTVKPGSQPSAGSAFFFEAKKNDYWTSRVAAEGHNPRLLWRSLNNVLRCGTESGLPSAPVSHSADDFQTFFQSKS